ncbi:MAG: ABC transporter permease [Myxococcaceae bacterium]|nr:ABC transporter permease [Myxococcaceae bacterium]MCI0671866.1 ABC transporter permease [Myxococcaceae bacterium]
MARGSMDVATVRVLAARDVTRFFRQPSRVIGALAQPILFWLVIGSGFQGSFRLPGAEGLGYMQYFFPGVVTMVLLFSAIFATITVIEDRKEGFLQCVLAGPGSRLSVVVGKALGASAIALLQASLFLLFAPLAGVTASSLSLPLLLSVMALTALALTAVGVSLAWWVQSSAGYHAVMSLLLIPMWVLSGAMFPVRGAGPVLQALMYVNPMRFAVEGMRRALYGDAVAASVGGAASALVEVGALGLFAVVFFALATVSVSRRP